MILIVDDMRANILALKKTLEMHGLQVDSAESGEEALKMVLKKSYSLIIMDVQMPVMDGFEVSEILSESNRTKDIPVIFLSAVSVHKKFISRGYESGGVDYITKPVDPDIFILRVKTLLKIYEQKNELKNIRDILSKEIEIRKEAQDNLEAKVTKRTRELVLKNEELEMRNHELQQFTWVVSHDLKEPIRKIQLFLKIIKDRYLNDTTGEADNYISRTLKAAERMQKLIADLLDYARLSSDVEPELTDLNKIVQEVLSDYDYLIENKKADICIGSLPVISAVPSQIRQVFQNLIGNSLKFSKSDVTCSIEIDAEIIESKEIDSPATPDGKFCRITVKDNGIGFEEAYIDKIFIIFQGLHDRNSYEGTGIGLAIAKKIIDKHNGLITAKSRTNEGASFIIILPV